MKAPAVAIENVSFWYEDAPVLEDISLVIEQGDFLGLVGPNGGGKTTLLRIVLGLLSPQKGRVLVFGKPPREGRQFIGYVPQHQQFDRDFPVSVMDVVLMGRLQTAPAVAGFRREDREAAELACREVEVYDLRKRRLGTLSGGQRQRALIARALAGQPRLLILDEPTANVDTVVQQEIYDLLRKLNEKVTIVLVSHDMGFVTKYVNRVACLNRVLLCHPTAAISGKMIEEMYRGPVHAVQHDHIVREY
jgi:zinc transport system ATP-binding protein